MLDSSTQSFIFKVVEIRICCTDSLPEQSFELPILVIYAYNDAERSYLGCLHNHSLTAHLRQHFLSVLIF